MEQIRLWLIILLIGSLFSGIVILIARFERQRRFPKYIPVLVLLLGAIGCIIKAREFSEGMEGLGYIVLAIMLAGGFVISLITAVVIDIRKRKNRHS